MDICTAIIVTATAVLACLAHPACQMHEGKLVCIPARHVACERPNPGYACKRSDGTEYWWEGPKALLPEEP